MSYFEETVRKNGITHEDKVLLKRIVVDKNDRAEVRNALAFYFLRFKQSITTQGTI